MRIAVVAAAVCLSVFGLAAVGNAQAAARKATSIPPQGLGPALQAFANERKVALVYRSELVDNLESQGAAGELTAEEALSRLLQGTGLTFRFLDDSTVTIVHAARANDQSERLHTSSLKGALQLAQAEQSETPGTAAEPAEDGSIRSESKELPRPEESGRAIPEMLVKGQRTINADIARTEDDTQPYVVFDRAQIERSAAGNLEEFLYKRLPMNTFRGLTTQSTQAYTTGNQSQVTLRGLSGSQTLILVDGRRVASTSLGTDFAQPDINGLPMAAIERVEVLPSTASGIYGGGATGGVINIITRKDYTGMELRATYGNAFDGDAATRRIDAAGGFRLEGGRTRVAIAASHADSGILRAGERDFEVRARARTLANNPDALFAPSTPPLGHLTNIRSANGSNLVLDDGTPLGSPRTFVPEGYAGPASDAGAALVANAGRYDLGMSDDYTGAQRAQFTGPTVESLSMNVRREFGEWVEAFVDVGWSENHGHTQWSFLQSTATIPADAPNNPFNTAINVAFPTVGMSVPDGESELTNVRGTGGLIVRLPRDWTASVDYTWNRTRLSAFNTVNAIGDPDGTGPAISAGTAVANGTLDVMRDLNAFPLDYAPYRLPLNSNVIGPNVAVLHDATARLTGPLFQLGGGPLTFSALLEHREEESEGKFSDTMNASAVTSVAYQPPRSQTVDSFYLEAKAPLISPSDGWPFLRELEVQASMRYDEYETKSPGPTIVNLSSRADPLPAFTDNTNRVHATESTFGLRFSPVEDVALRASYGTGFLPPSFSQIVPATTGTFQAQTLIDPKRGGVPALAGPGIVTRGGNPDLFSEESTSWSAGVILTPRLVPGLRLSLDYTHIEKRNEIGSLGFQTLLNLEDMLPGRVTRDPLTAADAALGYTGGAITGLDITLVNIADTRLEAYDLQADYTVQTDWAGAFHLYTVVTQQPHLMRQTLPTSPVLESVGYTLGVLKWRGNAGLTWQRGPWTLGWDAEYYSSYLAYLNSATPQTIASTTLTQGSDTIPRQIYHNVLAGYRFDTGFLADTEIKLDVQNVFDQRPPVVAATLFGFPTGGYADPRLRRYLLSIRKNF